MEHLEHLSSAGVKFHSNLIFKETQDYGAALFSAEDGLKAGSLVMTVPLALAITPASCKRSLLPILGSNTFSNHQLMVTYLLLHKVFTPTTTPEHILLTHWDYIEKLPTGASIGSSLYFTEEELNLLEGTNLKSATMQQKESWLSEWRDLQQKLNQFIPRETCSWALFLWASTILSSRAFPSTLIDPTDDPTPILIPGADLANHDYTAKISWVTQQNLSELHVIVDRDINPDEQIFYTYGAKPNEVWLLAYGFVIANNPADVYPVRLSIPDKAKPILNLLKLGENRHFIPRSGEPPAALLAQMRLLMGGDELLVKVSREFTEQVQWQDILTFVDWENELDTLDNYGALLESRFQNMRLPDVSNLPSETGNKIQIYYKGQMEILTTAIQVQEEIMDSTMADAEAAGFNIEE